MELHDVMRTTFAAREFTDEPVPDEVIRRILEDARFAPSGGNRQGWRVIVVREPRTRAAIAELAAPAIRRYRAQLAIGENPWNTIHPTRLDAAAIEKTEVPSEILDRYRRAPVLLVVCVDLAVVASMDQDLTRIGVISGASIYPFVWNILLAARDLGYGGTLTTFPVAREPDVQKLLGIPAQYAVAAVVPLGRPVKQLHRLTRRPVAEFAFRERFGGEPLC
jgi:nitroreductase